MLGGESDEGLLGAVRSDQGVDGHDVDVVQLLDGLLDLVLVGLEGDLEDKDVAVLDLLHRGLGGDWLLDDLVGVQSVVVWDALGGVLWRSGKLQGLWKSEGGRGSGLEGLLTVGTLDNSLLSSVSLSWGESDMDNSNVHGHNC